MGRYILLVLLIAVLSGCSSSGGIPLYSPVLKKNVIPRVKEATPNYCRYDGKVILRFTDPMNYRAISAILKKDCSGDATILFLGPFNSVHASVEIKDGEYNVTKSTKDVSENLYSDFTREIILLANSYLETPPVIVDESYNMFSGTEGYRFIKDNLIVKAGKNYVIYELETPYYNVNYVWKGSELRSIIISSEHMEIKLEFFNRWRKKA